MALAVKYPIAIEEITCDNGRVFKHGPGPAGSERGDSK
jgi:hypothetical protein